ACRLRAVLRVNGRVRPAWIVAVVKCLGLQSRAGAAHFGARRHRGARYRDGIMTVPGIAIVGLACRYPDAPTPAALWENVLAGRRAFRRIPEQRLRLEDYWSSDPRAEDATYGTWAAVIDGYCFDRLRFRVSAETYRSVDLAHWLALDVA